MKYRLTRDMFLLLCLWLVSPGICSVAGQSGSEPLIGQSSTIALSDTEREWVLMHPVIRLGVDPAWPPFDFVDRQGVHSGIAADFLQLLAKRIGVSVEVVPNISWNQALEGARARTLDMVSLSHATPKRLEFLTYTDVVTSVPWFIVTQKDFVEIDGLNDLAGLEVALVKGYAIEELVRSDYPDIKFRQVATPLDGLRSVASGQVEAMVESLAVASYVISENNLANLRIAADSGLDVMKLGFGVRSDWPQLVELLNRAIRSLSREEVRAINTRWASLAAPAADDEAPIAHGIWWLIAAGLIVLVLLIPVFLQRLSDRRQVDWFSSAAVRRIGSVAVTLFLVSVMVLAWYSLEGVQDRLRQNIGNQLSIINNSVHQALRTWFAGRSERVVDLSHEPQLLEVASALLSVPRNPQALRADSETARLRTLLAPRLDRMNATGVCIIAPDRLCIGSMQDADLGTANFISQQRPDLLDRVFAGETVFIPPIFSAGALPDREGQIAARASTMSFAAPLQDANGDVIAVLTLRFDPTHELTRITKEGRPGESGETYALDQNGRLLTESRFEASLIGAGIATDLGTRNGGVRGFRIADPGGDLLSGYAPETARAKWPLTLMASDVTRKRSGMNLQGYRDYRGVTVVGSWLWSDELGIGLATEIDLEEALAPYLALRYLVVGVLGITVLLAIGLTGFSVWFGDRAKVRLERLVGDRTRELNKLARAVEQSPLGVMITDVRGAIEHVNPSFVAVTGYELDEVIGKNPRVLRSGETAPSKYAELWQTILKGEVWRGELQNRKKNGELYWAAASVAPVTDSEGEVTNFVYMAEDVTAEKLAEAELKASVERFQVLFEASVDPYLILDGDRFTACNEAAVDLLRYSNKEELLVSHPGSLSPEFQPDGESSKDKAKAMIETAYARGNHRFDWVHRKKDGVDFPVEVTLTPIELEGKQVLLVVWHDLTERKQAEKEIAAREHQFRILVETIPGTVYQCRMDKDWTMLFISDEVERLSGYPASDFINNRMRTFASIIYPDDERHVEEAVAAAIKNRRPYTIDYRVVDAGGMIHSVHEQGQAIFGSDDVPESLVGTVIDISDRKAAEQKLRDSERRISEQLTYQSALLENAADGIVVIDEHGFVQTFSPAAERIFGYSASEVLGHNFKMLSPEPIRRKQDSDLRRYLEDGEARTVGSNREVEGQRKDGRTFPMDLAVGEVKLGTDRLYVAIIRDITDRKSTEEDLRQAKESAEEATRAKSDFLANMSHEIRTPMNAIIGLSHLALGTELDRKQRDYLNKVHSSANNLLGIINDILDFSKIEAGKLDMESVDFDLAEVLDNLGNVISVKSAEKGLELIVDLDPEVPLGLNGDPLRLNQILVNLANNAIKFTEAGEITISAALVERGEAGLMLRFAVKDTGIGMNPEEQGRLFQAFSQADTSTTRKFGGTGLGLSISKRLAEMMGGTIGVESEYGKGSTFWFTARFGLGARPEARVQRALPEALQDLRVLVVDDHPTARTILARYLESFGFSTGEVASGAEALDELERAELPYHLVLIDWHMPGMDGIETTRRILASRRIAPHPSIIMVSAYGREELVERAEAEGVKTFLVKPVSPSSLFDAILDATGHGVEQASEAGGTVPTQVHLRGASVLLVEDNEINQQVAEEILGQAGLQVTAANHGREGVEALAARPEAFDVVLMDIQMPVMDGYAAAQEIRKDPRFEALPIIAMTANAMAGDREKALAAGMNDHVSKPIDVKQLFEVLGKWASASASREEAPSVETEETTNESTDELNELVGFDVEKGLTRLAGNRKLYVKLLRDFARNHAGDAELIQSVLKRGDVGEARMRAHTLKGIAGNLAAQEVYEASAEMEARLTQDDDQCRTCPNTANLFSSLDEALGRAVEALRVLDSDTDQNGAYVAKTVGHEPKALTPDRALEVSAMIRDAIDIGDISQVEEVVELLPPDSAHRKKLSETLDNFDFQGMEDVATELEEMNR